MNISDMPKLESPFVREHDTNRRYLVTPKITEGYEWVFEDDNVLATEKLDGTDVSVVIENGVLISIWNRTERIPFFVKGKRFVIEGLLNSFERGYIMLPDGQHFGELIGPKVQGNPYKLEEHLWIPFDTYCRKKLSYNSWGKYPKTFEAISGWFKDGLTSLFMMQRGVKDQLAEGVVFHQPSSGKMAKLRRDMFDWYNKDGTTKT